MGAKPPVRAGRARIMTDAGRRPLLDVCEARWPEFAAHCRKEVPGADSSSRIFVLRGTRSPVC